jgi:hypothetical protein
MRKQTEQKEAGGEKANSTEEVYVVETASR